MQRGEVKKLAARIDSSRVTDVDIKYAEQTLDDNKKRLEAQKATFAEAQFDEKAKAKSSQIRELEADRDGFLKELASLNRESETRAKLSVKRADKQKKEVALQSLYVLLSACTEAILTPAFRLDRSAANHKTYVGTELRADTMESDVGSIMQYVLIRAR